MFWQAGNKGLRFSLKAFSILHIFILFLHWKKKKAEWEISKQPIRISKRHIQKQNKILLTKPSWEQIVKRSTSILWPFIGVNGDNTDIRTMQVSPPQPRPIRVQRTSDFQSAACFHWTERCTAVLQWCGIRGKMLQSSLLQSGANSKRASKVQWFESIRYFFLSAVRIFVARTHACKLGHVTVGTD